MSDPKLQSANLTHLADDGEPDPVPTTMAEYTAASATARKADPPETLATGHIAHYHSAQIIVEAFRYPGGTRGFAVKRRGSALIELHPIMKRSDGTFLFPISDDQIALPPVHDPQPQDHGELFRDLVAFQGRYITLPQDYRACFAAWVMGTWVHQAFASYPYLQFRGAPTSAKSAGLDVLDVLAYHPTGVLGSIRESYLTRGVMFFLPTMLMDEQDADLKPDIRDTIRLGFQAGRFIPRQVKDPGAPGGFAAMRLPVYCPKAFAGQQPVRDTALVTRIIQIDMTDTERGADVPVRFSRKTTPEFYLDGQRLQSRLLRWTMDNFHSIQERDPEGDAGDRTQGQVFAPLFGVTPANSEHEAGLYATMKRHRSRLAQEISSTEAGTVLMAVIRLQAKPSATPVIRPKTILKEISSREPLNPRTGRPWTTQHIVPILERNGISRVDADRVGAIYRVSPNALKKIRKLFGFSGV